MKRDKYDKIFSDLIRERADHTCEFCGLYIGKTLSCHCCHIHGRSSRSVRWDADNALCLCAKHHFFYTNHPTDFFVWLRDYLGEGYLEILSEKAHTVKKWTKADKADLYAHYKSEYKHMLEQRKQGVTGRITFLNYGF